MSEDIPYCADDMRTLYNHDMDPPFPYFTAELEEGAEPIQYKVKKQSLPQNVSPLFLLPEVGLDAFPVKNISQAPDISFSFSYPDIHTEVKAYDFALFGQKNGKLCKSKTRIYTAKKPEAEPPVPLKIFGRIGMKWGRFSLPYGTDIDQERNTIMISDCTNGLVQETDFAGNLVRIIGGNGSAPAQMSRPADVKIVDEKIYVIEEENHRYQVFTRDGDFVSAHGSRQHLKRKNKDDDGLKYEKGDEPGFNNPLGIALDKDKNIFVVDYDNYRVVKLSPEGKIIRIVGWREEFAGKTLDGPYYIDINEALERVYVVDRSNDRIVVFDTEGDFLFAFGESGTEKGQFDYPHEIEVAPDGRVFVADTNNRRIQIFNPDGKHLETIKIGAGYGLPKTVAVSKNGFVITGHLGRDAYMAVWKDPAFEGSEDELRAQIDALKAPQSIDLKIQKEKVEKTFDDTVYKRICISCHGDGALDAPRTKIDEDWERFPRDMDVLLALARQGKGAMMPSGGCEDCTDEELIEAIRFMLPDTWAISKKPKD